MAFFSSDSVGKVGLFCLRALGFQVVKILRKQNVILELCFPPYFFRCFSYDTKESCVKIRSAVPSFLYFRWHTLSMALGRSHSALSWCAGNDISLFFCNLPL